MAVKEVKVFETVICDLGTVSLEKHTATDSKGVDSVYYVLKTDSDELWIDSQEDFNEFKELINKF